MNTKAISGATIVQHIESISFDCLETADLRDLIFEMETRAETAFHGSSRCQTIPEEDLKPVIHLIAEMTAQCITVLRLGREIFFLITDEETGFNTNYTRDTLSTIEFVASDIIYIVEDLKSNRREMVEELVGKIIGHEVCHSYIARNFPEIEKVTRIVNEDPQSDAYKNDPGERACNRFGERFGIWRKNH